MPIPPWLREIFTYLLSAVSVPVLLWPLVSGLVYWWRPLWLLKVHFFLRRNEAEKLGLKDIFIRINGLFAYRQRVLDAWVKEHITKARENYSKKPTVNAHKVYVGIQSKLNDDNPEILTAQKLQPLFSSKTVRLLICGEGGSGKTNLAGQLGKWALSEVESSRLCTSHPLLPILIEQNFPEGPTAIVDVVRGELRELIGDPDPLPKDWVEELLRKKRLLVIVDGLSELSDTTRKQLQPEQPEFPIAALVITSRSEQFLRTTIKNTIQTQLLRTVSLVKFLVDYFSHLQKSELFEDRDLFRACEKLDLMRAVGDREITVLIAKMYADLMIASKEKLSHAELPGNIPDLMLSYVNEINSSGESVNLDASTAQRIAKAIGWQCLKRHFYPASAKKSEIVAVLNPDDAPRLKDLEGRLRLIQTVGVGRDEFRIILDPLAEYLAGMYLVEESKNKEAHWRTFLEQVRSGNYDSEKSRSFLRALHDCCLARVIDYGIPEKVIDEIAVLAGVSNGNVNEMQLERRIQRLIGMLEYPDDEDRLYAISSLSSRRINPKSKLRVAIPALCKSLSDPIPKIRLGAVRTIGSLGNDARSAANNLKAAINDDNAEVSGLAISALARVIKGDEDEETELIQIITRALEDRSTAVKQYALSGVATVGIQARECVPLVMEALESSDEAVRLNAKFALKSLEPDPIETIPLLIDKLKRPKAQFLLTKEMKRKIEVSIEGAITDFGEVSIPYIRQLIKEKDQELCQIGISLAWLNDSIFQAFIPDLIEIIQNKEADEWLRWHAIWGVK